MRERCFIMIDINKLLESKRLEITFADVNVDRAFVKAFRKEHGLTQSALANILGVTKKTIEKWEQGKNNIGGSSAVLLNRGINFYLFVLISGIITIINHIKIDDKEEL